MAEERRKEIAASKAPRETGECPERLEGGPHRWVGGAPGSPDWCWFCEIERTAVTWPSRRTTEEFGRLQNPRQLCLPVETIRRPHQTAEHLELCSICGSTLPDDEPGVCAKCVARGLQNARPEEDVAGCAICGDSLEPNRTLCRRCAEQADDLLEGEDS